MSLWIAFRYEDTVYWKCLCNIPQAIIMMDRQPSLYVRNAIILEIGNFWIRQILNGKLLWTLNTGKALSTAENVMRIQMKIALIVVIMQLIIELVIQINAFVMLFFFLILWIKLSFLFRQDILIIIQIILYAILAIIAGIKLILLIS